MNKKTQMFSKPAPDGKPKYRGFGPALRVRTGTAKRSPPAGAASPPPQCWARGIVIWQSTRAAMACIKVLGTKVVLFDPTETPTSQRWGVFSNQRLQSDGAGVSDQRGAHAGRQAGDPRTSLAHVGEGAGKSCPCVHLEQQFRQVYLRQHPLGQRAEFHETRWILESIQPGEDEFLAPACCLTIRTAAFCRQRPAVRRYASSSSRPMFSRNGSGVEDNPSIRHVEVRALPQEPGPSSCARGPPHWVLLETKTSRRRNALRSCSRTQNVKLRENAPPVGVHDPEVELGTGVALLSVNEEPSHRCGIVATAIRCHSFVKCLPRRDWRAGQRSQPRRISRFLMRVCSISGSGPLGAQRRSWGCF